MNIILKIKPNHLTMQNFLKLLEQNRKLDPFYKQKESQELFSWLLWEINEAQEEYDKWNFSELQSEMWDVLWTLFLLLDKLEDEGKISKQEVFEKITTKISNRKSFLLEDREVSKEEAQKIWNDAKRKEWYEEKRLWND